MKKKPLIQDFKVPEHVFVNMQNGQDYVLVPLSNLDEDEINTLIYNFAREVRRLAGTTAPPVCM